MDILTKKIVLLGRYGNNDGITKLSRKLLIGDDASDVEIDLSYLRWIELGPMTYLLGTLKGWQEKGIQISFTGIKNMNGPISYMSRMKFFSLLGCQFEDNRNCNIANSKFVDYREIENTERRDSNADALAESIATCIAGEQCELDIEDFTFSDYLPEDGFYDSIVYSVTELVKNVQQHSRGTGYIGAQYYPTSDVTQIAIIDTGIGIRGSFIHSDSPYAAKITDDISALKKALEPEVSSKFYKNSMTGDSENAGVGLTFLKELVSQTEGRFQAVSGGAMLYDGNSSQLTVPYQGTYICLSFKRKALNRFHFLLEDVKVKYLGELDTNSDEIEDIFGDYEHENF